MTIGKYIVLYECVTSDSPMSNKNLIITLVVDISYIIKYDIIINVQIKYAYKNVDKNFAILFAPYFVL